MGLSKEERDKRKDDPHVRDITTHITDCSKGEDFVFISYKSDDWEVVLHDLVYDLMTKYGLRAYFDGSFDEHNDTWIKQFPLNMESSHCKAMLMFIDDAYATSYATLLELMYSQRRKTSKGGKYDGERLPVIPINLNGTIKIPKDEADEDTGLGKEKFGDNNVNVMAGREKALFDKVFKELVYSKGKGLYGISEWYDYDDLNKWQCHKVTAQLLEILGISENYYYPGKTKKDNFLESIVKIIEEETDKSVFGKPLIPHFSSKTVLSDEELFERLRKLRVKIAQEEGVRPFMIFHDKTLKDMCIRKPKNRVEMLEVSGVGTVKHQKYGERFLKVLNED